MIYTVHTDGGSRGNPGNAAIGVVVEADGKTLWEHARAIGVTTNNVAEYTAVIAGLEHCVTLSPPPDKIVFYLDSLLVVQQLSRRYKINNVQLKDLAQKAWAFVAALPCPVEFVHVPRNQNKEADALVNAALDAL